MQQRSKRIKQILNDNQHLFLLRVKKLLLLTDGYNIFSITINEISLINFSYKVLVLVYFD